MKADKSKLHCYPYAPVSYLTKRELFAAMVLQGLQSAWDNIVDTSESAMAEMAVSQADALIAALNEETE